MDVIELGKLIEDPKLRHSFERWVMTYLTRDKFLAEEVIQHTYLKAWENSDKFDGKNLIGWLKTIANNSAKNMYKRKIPDTGIDGIEDLLIDKDTPEGRMALRAILNILDNLKPPKPEIMKRFAIGETHEEISKAIGIGRTTITGLIKDAKREIEEEFFGERV